MRTIQIKHEEIELIKQALQIAYDQQLEIIAKNRKILSQAARDEIVKSANAFFDAQEIFDGERDV